MKLKLRCESKQTEGIGANLEFNVLGGNVYMKSPPRGSLTLHVSQQMADEILVGKVCDLEVSNPREPTSEDDVTPFLVLEIPGKEVIPESIRINGLSPADAKAHFGVEVVLNPKREEAFTPTEDKAMRDYETIEPGDVIDEAFIVKD